MIKALFDEKRRAEIRDALKYGRKMEFRGKLPAAEAPRRGIDEVEVLRQMIYGERAEESLKRLETISKGQGEEGIHSKLTKAIGKAYGTTRYVSTAGLTMGRMDAALMGVRIAARMAKAEAAAKTQKPKEGESEEPGKNQ